MTLLGACCLLDALILLALCVERLVICVHAQLLRLTTRVRCPLVAASRLRCASCTGGATDDPGGASLMPAMTKEQAIRVIQKNERGRQGAERAKRLKVWILVLFSLALRAPG